MCRKLTLSICIGIILICLSTIFSFASNSEYLGDVDGNGKVTAADARIILRHSADLEYITDIYSHLADINGDEMITTSDARITLRMAVGLEDLFKTGEKYHLHEYKTVVLKKASCSEKGEKQSVCSVCEYTKTETIEKLPHSYLDATCTKPKTCKVCKETEGDRKEHEYVTTSCFSPATCKNCGVTSGEATGHIFSGLKCTKCGKQYDSMEDYAIMCIRNDLMNRLKNPNSLMVFDMYYTIPNKEECVFVIWIQISAMNSYGGYTRETVKYGIDANGNAYYDRVYLWDTTPHSMNTDYVKKQLGLS